MENIFIYVFLFFVVVGIMLSVWNDWSPPYIPSMKKKTTVFTPEIPSIDEYLKVILDNFFSIHQMVSTEMNKLRVEEESVK